MAVHDFVTIYACDMRSDMDVFVAISPLSLKQLLIIFIGHTSHRPCSHTENDMNMAVVMCPILSPPQYMTATTHMLLIKIHL